MGEGNQSYNIYIYIFTCGGLNKNHVSELFLTSPYIGSIYHIHRFIIYIHDINPEYPAIVAIHP